MELKKVYVKAYKLGKELSKEYSDIRDAYCDNRVNDIIGWDFNGVEALFFKAGYKNAEMPVWVSGWRYGNIPECGFSMNYREQKKEDGISMMEVAVNGETIGTEDKISALFIEAAGRKIVKCEGWLNTYAKGSDGEPLIVGAVEVE